MVNDRRAAIKKLKKLVFAPKAEIETFRKKIEEEFTEIFLPNRVEREEKDIGGIPCDILSPMVYATDRVMVYIHGGSFIGGSRASWRSFCASLAHASSTKIILPEIRLAPKFPFPAALDDIKDVFKTICVEEPDILIGADGSGASIAMGLLLSLKEKVRERIKEIVLFSPWLDFSDDAPIFKTKKLKDEIITVDAIKRTGNMYTYSSNLSNPLVSPLYMKPSMMGNFPEIYIQMGEKEVITSEAERFCNLLRENNVKYTFDVEKDMMHMFQMADEYLNEAHLAIERVGTHIRIRNEEEEEAPGKGAED
ncbi:MAG: alpha/beta hydrolase [Treponemataceae bacterium]|nr:alpha/beta hydrolase [Treponemataceae bacterium]